MTQPRSTGLDVSVIVPTVGRRALLERTLQALLDQTHQPSRYEVIVVDDASSETYEWLPDRVQLVRRNVRGGPGGARNTGLQVAQGELVAFTDDDCIVPSDWLTSIVDAFRRYPMASSVGGLTTPDSRHLGSAAARFERHCTMDYYHQMKIDPFHEERAARADVSPAWGTGNLAWRVAPLRGLGGFLEGTAQPEDSDLARRAGAAGCVAVFVPMIVLHNRKYSWTDLWHRYEFQGRGKGRGDLLTALGRATVRLPYAMIRDLGFLFTLDMGLFAAAVVRDVARSAGAVREALVRGRYRNR